eukprot:TRINITY_DN1771_c0_g1_i1.p1 TRINITY_DN1771_c0_g1~~TRINITY_DN1771_c0_g1_i1.p1  ORF type:complete len:295 (-),score=40.33 TRINITY_DN1771_c0_g1_i1:109-993(-)
MASGTHPWRLGARSTTLCLRLAVSVSSLAAVVSALRLDDDAADAQPAIASKALDPFDCNVDLDKWRTAFSSAKQSWCCEQKGFACKALPDVEPDLVDAVEDVKINKQAHEVLEKMRPQTTTSRQLRPSTMSAYTMPLHVSTAAPRAMTPSNSTEAPEVFQSTTASPSSITADVVASTTLDAFISRMRPRTYSRRSKLSVRRQLPKTGSGNCISVKEEELLVTVIVFLSIAVVFLLACLVLRCGCGEAKAFKCRVISEQRVAILRQPCSSAEVVDYLEPKTLFDAVGRVVAVERT